MKRKIYYALPALTIMIIIFCFSAQPAEQSNKSSDFVVDTLISVAQKMNIISENTAMNVPEENLHMYTFIIRKLAHTLEYAVLGWCISLYLSSYSWKKRTRFLTALLAGFIYAISDELHQCFVPGRSCEFRDVLIDTNGVLIGIIVFMVIMKKKTKQIGSA